MPDATCSELLLSFCWLVSPVDDGRRAGAFSVSDGGSAERGMEEEDEEDCFVVGIVSFGRN